MDRVKVGHLFFVSSKTFRSSMIKVTSSPRIEYVPGVMSIEYEYSLKLSFEFAEKRSSKEAESLRAPASALSMNTIS